MNRPPKRGFTLTELLVVIAIVGLLLALLAPSMRGAWQNLNQTHCAANLFRIGQAFAVRANDETLGSASAFRVAGWGPALLPYLENNPDVLICPEADVSEAAVGDTTVSGPLRVHFVGDGWDYYTRLDGPYAAKMSDRQYRACLAAGYLSHGKDLSTCPVYSGYGPDDRPHIVWFCIEELAAGYEHLQPGAAARDFEDIRMKITDNGDGTVNLFFELGSGQIDAYIVTTDSSTPLVKIPKGHPRHDFGAGPFAAAGGAATKSNYGMNRAAVSMGSGGGTILALDYARIVASSDDIWTDPATKPKWGYVPMFARHMGRVNVLFADGSVKIMDPQQINPTRPSVAETYWEP